MLPIRRLAVVMVAKKLRHLILTCAVFAGLSVPASTAPAATIANFFPTSGSAGTTVAIDGTNLDSVTNVTFNGLSAGAPIVLSAGTIQVNVPAGALTGRLLVSSPTGDALSATEFTVTPRILSFTPASGPAGTSVQISGASFTGATSVRFGNAPANFVVDSDSQITATVPANAPPLCTILVQAQGSSSLSGSLFTVIPSPTIDRFIPVQGPVGATVTISGPHMGLVTEVTFNGVPVDAIVVMSPTSIRAIVPAGATTGTISVTNPAGSAVSATEFRVLPKIDSFAPVSGVPGTSVQITGTSFTGATEVRFGAVTTTFTLDSDTRITATVPVGAVTGKIRVITEDGTAASTVNFAVLRIVGFNPPSGSVGTTVTINGANLDTVTEVTFNGVAAEFLPVGHTATSIQVYVPAGATTGKIRLTSPIGAVESATDFRVLPKIASFTPLSGVPGTSVQITGTNFTGATEVRFGAVTASFTLDSDTRITATVPVGAVTGKIRVITEDGTAVSTVNFAVLRIVGFNPPSGSVGTTVTINGANLDTVTEVTFNGVAAEFLPVGHTATSIQVYVPAGATTGKIRLTSPIGSVESATDFRVLPKITGFTPLSGVPGTSVQITGTNFTGATEVRFGAVTATFALDSDTRITATVPVGAVTAKIRVITPDGPAVTAADFAVLRIAGFNPPSGSVGTTVTINGANLDTVTEVTFNGVAAEFLPVGQTATSIQVYVPAGATTGKIRLTSPIGSVESATDFRVGPKITSFSPVSGVPGTSVQITGTNFTGATEVRFGAVTATFALDSDTQITATVPAGAATGKIRVITPDGTAVSASNFIVSQSPTISSFTPVQGPVGTVVTINGANLGNVTEVTFNGVSAGAPVSQTSSTLQVNVPAGATTGRIGVTNAAGSALGATDFTVLPRIDQFTPVSGLPGTSVQITGLNFTGATQVLFDTLAASFTVDSDTQITATVPAGAVAGRIFVITPDGTAASASNFSVPQPPTIASFAPMQGPVGTVVTIYGTNLGSVTDVTFNGVSAGAPQVPTAISIETTVPANATRGPIGVTNSAGTATSDDFFTVTPRMDSFSPTHGAVGDLVTITGTTLVDGAGAPVVRFGAIIADLVSYAAASVVARVPVGAVTSSISLTTLDGLTTSATDFVVDAPDATAVLSVDGVGYSTSKVFWGGSFLYMPEHADYTLRNTGSAPMSWSAEVSDPWLLASPVSGTLEPGDSVIVRVSIEAALANTLSSGEYTGRVYFSNRSGGTGSTTRPVILANLGIWPLQVRPAYSFLATGSVQTPPAPATFTYTLTNLNTVIPVDWSGTSNQSWVQLSSSGGMIPGFQSVDVMATLGPGPTGFPIGISAATLTFTQFNCCPDLLNFRFVKVIITEDDPPGLTVDAPVHDVVSATLSGTVTDNGTIAALVWSNAKTGETGSIEINQGVWAVTIPLWMYGMNDVTVTAFDDLGNFSSRTLSIDATSSPVAAQLDRAGEPHARRR